MSLPGWIDLGAQNDWLLSGSLVSLQGLVDRNRDNGSWVSCRGDLLEPGCVGLLSLDRHKEGSDLGGRQGGVVEAEVGQLSPEMSLGVPIVPPAQEDVAVQLDGVAAVNLGTKKSTAGEVSSAHFQRGERRFIPRETLDSPGRAFHWQPPPGR